MPYTSEIQAGELIPYWSKVVEDVDPTKFEIEDLEFISVFRKGELRMKGTDMKELARNAGAFLGLTDGKRILENQIRLPADLRSKIILLFGTVVQKRFGRLNMPFLWYVDDKWEINWAWVEQSWADDSCVVPRLRPRQSAAPPLYEAVSEAAQP